MVARFSLGLAIALAMVGCAARARALTRPRVLTCQKRSGWSTRFAAPSSGLAATHSPRIHATYTIHGEVISGAVRVIGLGDYQMAVNGVRVTNALSNQPWSQYDRRLYWRTFDLTSYLHTGHNKLEITLGASYWYVGDPPPGYWVKDDAISRFDPEHPFLLSVDGTIHTTSEDVPIRTGETWTWTPSPLVFTHILAGEDYDARLEQTTTAERPVEMVCAPDVQFTEYFGPTLISHEVQEPLRFVQHGPGVYSYIFPQNSAATLRFEMQGARGKHVSFVPSESITNAGDVEQLNLHGARASIEYTLAGSGRERHETQFFYHGYRYVRVEGAVPVGQPNPDHLPILRSLQSVNIRIANPEYEAFTSSNDLYNRIHDLINWSFRSNSSYVLTDCPHREKLGWLETAYLLQPALAYRFDIKSWYDKISQDLIDAQEPNGLLRTVAPYYLTLPDANPFAFTVEWSAAAVLIPWQHYQLYGDLARLRQSYLSMRAFVEALTTRSPGGIAPGGLGDWYDYGHGQPPGPSRWTPPELSATATYAMCTTALIEAARALGEVEDVARYSSLFGIIRDAFWARFYDAASGQLRNNGSPQTAHAMALEAGLVPVDAQPKIVGAIVADLEARGWQQTTGDIGQVYLIRALAKAGRSDVLHRVYSRTGIGSYGGILNAGLTALPETWDARTDGSLSLNHAMLGHVIEWYYAYVLGIRQSPSSVAWSEVVIGPNPGPLAWARGSVATPAGLIRVAWTKHDNILELRVEVPLGVRARAVLPPGIPARVTYDGTVIADAPRKIDLLAGTSVIEVEYAQ